MLEMLMQWYRRRFSDPEAIALLVILVAGFGIIFSLVACLLRCWWLLCWPICWNGQPCACNLLAAPPLGDVDCIGGFRRYIATDGVRGIAYRLAAGHLLNSRYAGDAQ